ncbi:hypothetical protein GCM10010172_66400 [Paractinoplanes ferrugineus]|uniref:Uncharacterized protein n=1 Tax=Paractinoplanes ferrugineus TaxID=113564 RepID=A0A919J3W9_9ACTN|nr:hypothetical protein [Actinoplanes ferrugineus]GIE13199.1 hypothetical protein Afe05nite_50390 [Actinoplanes ferrugineus]
MIAAAAVLACALAAAGVLWLTGRGSSSAPLRAGPLEGTNFEELRARTEPSQSGLLWGSLVLHNPTKNDIVLHEVTLAGNPQSLEPTTAPYLWGPDRVALLGTGAVSGYALPLPAAWKIPPRHEVTNYRIAPQTEEESVEVVFEFPVPTHTSELHGITVRYRMNGLAYRKTFDVNLTICAPEDPSPCRKL